MTEKEFKEKICSKCKNRNNEKDLCNIVMNIKGELQCVYEEEERK